MAEHSQPPGMVGGVAGSRFLSCCNYWPETPGMTPLLTEARMAKPRAWPCRGHTTAHEARQQQRQQGWSASDTSCTKEASGCQHHTPAGVSCCHLHLARFRCCAQPLHGAPKSENGCQSGADKPCTERLQPLLLSSAAVLLTRAPHASVSTMVKPAQRRKDEARDTHTACHRRLEPH